MELRPPPSKPQQTAKIPLGPLVVLQLITIAVMGGLFFIGQQQATAPSQQAADTRVVASKLKAAGALESSADLYADYLESSGSVPNRGQIALSLANSYIDLGRYEAALRWLYEAEATADAALQPDIAQRLVQVLERMGRTHAARAVLSGSTELTPDEANRAPDDQALAKVGSRTIYQSDLNRMLDELPKEIASQLAGPENQPKLLQQYLADELLWRKAQKLGYDQKPQVQRQLAQMLKRIVVGRFLEEEVMGPIQTDPADLQTFFKANQERYQDGDTPPKFEDVQARVTQDYRTMKVQSAYAKVVADEMAAGDVQILPAQAAQ